MAEIIEPPIPLPPAPGPAGLPDPIPPAAPDKTRTQAGAVITAVGGAVMVLAVFLPLFSLSDGVNYQYWPMTNTPDVSFFLPVGLGIAVVGLSRLYNDHMATRVIVVLAAAWSAKAAITDANNINQYFLSHYSSSGLTLTYGPALLMLGAASVAAIAGSFVTSSSS